MSSPKPYVVFSTKNDLTGFPKDATAFTSVHQDFCALMKAVEQNPNVLQSCTKQGLQEKLNEMNDKLDKFLGIVSAILEQKRCAFPRFYFLSDQDVLKIVCYAFHPEALSRYLYKVFEHMESLVFEASGEARAMQSQQIVAVRSLHGEMLYLVEPLACEGPVEQWFHLLMDRMRISLQQSLHAALGHESCSRREIHSAGARRVLVSRSASSKDQEVERE
ncbi:uncharacterized protein LOC127529006 [Erpetoichthys calabaricus]|uniref:uncharacterized protein LOC127529006 n=1 Tax=Erpetoichthys calabaricus TaxID=27687 RepID=UPI00223435FA|nr:uncharacterized protein LOC127529006 [Erpetoichthys calabaricus]